MTLECGVSWRAWALPFGIVWIPGILLEFAFLCFYLDFDSWEDA